MKFKIGELTANYLEAQRMCVEVIDHLMHIQDTSTLDDESMGRLNDAIDHCGHARAIIQQLWSANITDNIADQSGCCEIIL